jgi:hypothetical protein
MISRQRIRGLVVLVDVDLGAHRPGQLGVDLLADGAEHFVHGELGGGLRAAEEQRGAQVDVVGEALVVAEEAGDVGVVGVAAGVVAGGEEELGDGVDAVGEAGGLGHRGVALGVHAGEDGAEGGLGPRGLREGVGVEDAVVGEALEVGGDRLGLGVEGLDVVGAEGVHGDEEDVGPGGLGLGDEDGLDDFGLEDVAEGDARKDHGGIRGDAEGDQAHGPLYPAGGDPDLEGGGEAGEEGDAKHDGDECAQLHEVGVVPFEDVALVAEEADDQTARGEGAHVAEGEADEPVGEAVEEQVDEEQARGDAEADPGEEDAVGVGAPGEREGFGEPGEIPAKPAGFGEADERAGEDAAEEAGGQRAEDLAFVAADLVLGQVEAFFVRVAGGGADLLDFLHHAVAVGAGGEQGAAGG